MTELLHRDLTEKIIGVYYDVYNGLGHTYPEFIYENAMMRDLRRRRITCARQEEYRIFYRIYANACYREMQARGLAVQPQRQAQVFYRNEPVGTVKLAHLQIENKIMLFPMAVRDMQQLKPDNLRQWMTSQCISLGILANFHAERLVPEFVIGENNGLLE